MVIGGKPVTDASEEETEDQEGEAQQPDDQAGGEGGAELRSSGDSRGSGDSR